MQEMSTVSGSRGAASQQVSEVSEGAPSGEAKVTEPAEPANRIANDRSEIKHGLYVYCIVPSDSPREYGRIGVGTDSLVYAIPFKDLAAIVSDFEGDSLDKTDTNLLAHQRVVQKILEKVTGIPVKFGTVREDEEDVRNVLEEGYSDFQKELSELTPKGSAKQLLEFWAKDPPGSHETLEALSAAASERTQGLEKRLDTLLSEVTEMRRELPTQTAPDASLVAAVTSEQQKIREALGDLRNLHTDNAASIGFQLGNLASGFEKLQARLTENAASLEKTVRETIIEAISLAVEQALAKQTSPAPPYARARPEREAITSEFTWCISCGTAIGLTDRFCDHCGRPAAPTQGS